MRPVGGHGFATAIVWARLYFLVVVGIFVGGEGRRGEQPGAVGDGVGGLARWGRTSAGALTFMCDSGGGFGEGSDVEDIGAGVVDGGAYVNGGTVGQGWTVIAGLYIGGGGVVGR